MGMCLDHFDKVSIEVRRESFKIHASYGYKTDANGDEVHAEGDFAELWRGPSPEFLLEDLDSLIKALQDAKKYIKSKR